MVVHTSKWSSGLDDNVTIQNVLPLNCEKSDIENWVRSNSDIWESIGRSMPEMPCHSSGRVKI